MTSKMIEVWTDGSCYAGDRIGGWGAVVIVDEVDLEISGSAVDTTSNRMELMAVLNGLRLVKTPSNITVFTDSQYVQGGIIKRGWMDRGPDNINYSLWVKMNKIIDHHLVVKALWVKGHSGIKYNERADVLAGDARQRRLKRKLR